MSTISTTPRTNPERSEATRTALLAAARKLFVEQGYAATGTPALVAAAGVTRGALYHHFEDKAALLHAVALQMAAEVAAAIEAATRGRLAPAAALQRGAEAYFAAMAAEGRARLLLLEVPAALGPAAVAAVNEAAGGDALRQGLHAALGDGSRLPVDELAAVLSAAFDRAALAVATGERPARYQAAVKALVAAVAALGRP